MTTTEEVRRYADAIMALIKEDQDTGQVPRDVVSWDELDNTVDTDDYCRQVQLPSGTAEASDLRDAVSDEVGLRLTQAQGGGPWLVTWTHPDGHSLDVSRTMGYATREEAEAVGRAYRTGHGGAYRVHTR